MGIDLLIDSITKLISCSQFFFLKKKRELLVGAVNITLKWMPLGTRREVTVSIGTQMFKKSGSLVFGSEQMENISILVWPCFEMVCCM